MREICYHCACIFNDIVCYIERELPGETVAMATASTTVSSAVRTEVVTAEEAPEEDTVIDCIMIVSYSACM